MEVSAKSVVANGKVLNLAEIVNQYTTWKVSFQNNLLSCVNIPIDGF